MFSRLLRSKPATDIGPIYGAIVAQARMPIFYADYGVPDTFAGRFDLLVLHLHLVMRRLSAETNEPRGDGRRLLERFFEDMDGNLRELGIGDLSVPRAMGNFAQAYFGRAERYDGALRQTGNTDLAEALLRNVFAGRADAAAGAARLARYARRAETLLARVPAGDIVCGMLELPRPEEVE
jgi:cytochrome b pre-mRNA-processing protein 3